MERSTDYIILLTDCTHKFSAKNYEFKQGRTEIIDIKNTKQVHEKAFGGVPRAIIIYLEGDDPRDISSLMDLRRDAQMDHVPVLVFSRRPTKTDIQSLLSQDSL